MLGGTADGGGAGNRHDSSQLASGVVPFSSPSSATVLPPQHRLIKSCRNNSTEAVKAHAKPSNLSLRLTNVATVNISLAMFREA